MCLELSYPHKATGNRQRELQIINYEIRSGNKTAPTMGMIRAVKVYY